MQFLELAESSYHIGLIGQTLCLLAKGYLGFHVLLEVILAELVVEFLYVIELLGILLVCFPQLVGLIGRNLLYIFPLLQESLEFII